MRLRRGDYIWIGHCHPGSMEGTCFNFGQTLTSVISWEDCMIYSTLRWILGMMNPMVLQLRLMRLRLRIRRTIQMIFSTHNETYCLMIHKNFLLNIILLNQTFSKHTFSTQRGFGVLIPWSFLVKKGLY